MLAVWQKLLWMAAAGGGDKAAYQQTKPSWTDLSAVIKHKTQNLRTLNSEKARELQTNKSTKGFTVTVRSFCEPSTYWQVVQILLFWVLALEPETWGNFNTNNNFYCWKYFNLKVFNDGSWQSSKFHNLCLVWWRRLRFSFASNK